MTIYQRMVELAELLFPSYYVTKGWAMEECGHALLQDTRKILDAKDMLQRAKQQYEICRGRESDLVRRVEDALSKLNEPPQPMAMTAPPPPPDDDDDAAAAAAADSSSNDDDKNELIILSNGTARVLFEIKTYESPPEDCSWEMLAERIRLQFPSFQWSPHHRLYPIGYGIQSLLLSCEMPESLKEQVAQEIEDAEDSIIQHVDLVVAQEYTY
jgi:translation elongation factor EF-1beta